MSRIVVLGSVNADLVVTAERAPAGGETLHGDAFHIFPGGKGANQAVGAARLLPGAVSFVGRVGSDVFGTMLLASLREAGVLLNDSMVVEGSSGVAVITVERSGQNRIVIVPGANAQVTADFVRDQQALLQQAGFLLLQLEVPLPAVQAAAELAANAGASVILDPAPARALEPGLLQHVTWLTPNYSEACVLTGRPQAEDPRAEADALLDALLALGPRNVLLKLGEFGCALATASGERQRVGAYRVRAVDTTAAGDAFNAGFAVALAEGRSPVDAAEWASAVAAIAVTRMGAQTSMPAREEVEQFVREQRAALV